MTSWSASAASCWLSARTVRVSVMRCGANAVARAASSGPNPVRYNGDNWYRAEGMQLSTNGAETSVGGRCWSGRPDRVPTSGETGSTGRYNAQPRHPIEEHRLAARPSDPLHRHRRGQVRELPAASVWPSPVPPRLSIDCRDDDEGRSTPRVHPPQHICRAKPPHHGLLLTRDRHPHCQGRI